MVVVMVLTWVKSKTVPDRSACSLAPATVSTFFPASVKTLSEPPPAPVVPSSGVLRASGIPWFWPDAGICPKTVPSAASGSPAPPAVAMKHSPFSAHRKTSVSAGVSVNWPGLSGSR